jgi:hypothetical protein
MIAIGKPSSAARRQCSGKDRDPDFHERFLDLLPGIRRRALVSFRDLNSEAREEAVQAAVGLAWANFRRLVALGRAELAFAGPLARYAVARVRDGRGIGTRRNMRDVTSLLCQHRRGLQIESLDQLADHDGQWREMVVEDRRAGPAEIAAARIDLAAWLRLLPRRDRVIAKVLASGETTRATAKLFHISPGRVSQIRRELYEAWCHFQGEFSPPAEAAASLA